MTREELKDHCKRQIAHSEFWAMGDNEKLDNSKLYQEHKLILELLQQEPCEDTISRKEALEAFKPRGISQDAWEESNVYKTIKALPTVIPERPKGEWKSDGHGHIFCTACNQTNVSMWKSDFCPICGSYNGQTRKE